MAKVKLFCHTIFHPGFLYTIVVSGLHIILSGENSKVLLTNSYVKNVIIAQKYMKQKVMESKGKIDNLTTKVGDFNFFFNFLKINSTPNARFEHVTLRSRVTCITD